MLSIAGVLAWVCVAGSAAAVPTEGAIEYVTRDEALRRFTTDPEPFELRWSKDWQYNSEYKFLFSNHSRGTYRAIFCAYLKLSKGYVLIKRIDIGNPDTGVFLYFDHFSAFWRTQPVPPHEQVPLIWLQEVTDGSGHLETGKYFFTVAVLPPPSDLEKTEDIGLLLPHVLQGVEFRWPPDPFPSILHKGESWRRGHGLRFDEHQMTFRNEIYQTGDRVYGTFKLVAERLDTPLVFGPIRVTTKYRIETDSVRRVSLKQAE